MKKVSSFLIFMIVCVLLASVFSILMFHVPIFNEMHVLMYKGLFIIFLTAVILFVALLLIKKNKSLYDIKDIVCIVIVFICVNVTFFTLVPVTVERSVSVFTLSQIEEMPNDNITIDEAENIFNAKYIKKNGAFEKRFDEQIVTGSIKKNQDNSYTLTNFGHFLVSAFRVVGKLYGADCKNLY